MSVPVVEAVHLLEKVRLPLASVYSTPMKVPMKRSPTAAAAIVPSPVDEGTILTGWFW